MVGSGVLLECLDDDRVSAVLVIGRSPCGLHHPKLREILHQDFFDYSGIGADLAGHDACFFCLGMSAAGKTEPEYTRLTFDLTVAAAEAVLAASPHAAFCYVSGQGTDSTEKGRFMWARVKGKTENHLLKMPFEQAYMFRPGFIQPLKGVRSNTKAYRALYAVSGPVYPVLRRLAPNAVTTTEKIGQAMIEVVLHGSAKRVLEMRDINRLAVTA